MSSDDAITVKSYNTSTITNQKKIKFLTNLFDKPQKTHRVYLHVAILEIQLKTTCNLMFCLTTS
jgi:hypothetical protein